MLENIARLLRKQEALYAYRHHCAVNGICSQTIRADPGAGLHGQFAFMVATIWIRHRLLRFPVKA
jgi:hypothetical protein